MDDFFPQLTVQTWMRKDVHTLYSKCFLSERVKDNNAYYIKAVWSCFSCLAVFNDLLYDKVFASKSFSLSVGRFCRDRALYAIGFSVLDIVVI